MIALLGCYNGYYSKGGAQGVGQATTNAVVASSILILAFDYVLTALFFGKMSDAPKIRLSDSYRQRLRPEKGAGRRQCRRRRGANPSSSSAGRARASRSR